MPANAIRIHLVAMALLVAVFAALYVAVAPRAPALNLTVWIALNVAFLLVWIVLLFARLRGMSAIQTRIAIQWLGHAIAIPGFPLVLAYADEGVQLVAVILALPAIVVAALSTMQAAEAGGRLSPLPFVMPAAIAAFFTFESGRFAPIVIAVMAGLSLLILLLRRELQRILVELAQAREAAEGASRMRTRFFASASHDLRQPLQSAALFVDQMSRSGDTERRAEAARNARNALDATQRQLRQMLDHLQLDAGAIVAHGQWVPVGPLISEITSQFEPLAALSQVKLIVLPSDARAFADADLAGRALANLIDNALRHASGHRVLVGARRHGDRTRIYVVDDGLGVPEVERPRLFDEFVQGDPGGRERGGFGLGLASARRLARLMDGDVGLDHRWTRGSAFFLELPTDAAIASRRSGRRDAQLPGVRRSCADADGAERGGVGRLAGG